jgi:SAM-dependent methyltransferase
VTAPAPHARATPPITNASYLLLRSLAVQIEREARLRLAGRPEADTVDIGCGDRPYEPLLRPYSRSYVGVDLRPGPGVDVVASAERLPFEDASFDCALCTQVLEHAEDPAAIVSELHRILRPGGVALISTHGVARYHAAEGVADDYWRWTHAGLARLIEGQGAWSEVAVHPNGGSAAAIAFLLGRESEVIASKLRLAVPLRPWIAALNLIAGTLDRLRRTAAPARPPGAAPNYLAVAVR